MTDKDYKFVVYHGFKIPTTQYGNQDFSFTVRGDDMKEVVKDLKKLKELYPPVIENKKPVLCPDCLGVDTLYKTQSQGMWVVKCRGGSKKYPCKYVKKYKLTNQPNL